MAVSGSSVDWPLLQCVTVALLYLFYLCKCLCVQPAMNYKMVATAVFTPLEIGTVGLSEEDAIAANGADNVDAYISAFSPLEFAPLHLEGNPCLAKVVVNKKDQKVLGMHIAAPNAGEIIQGYAVAMRQNITYNVSKCFTAVVLQFDVIFNLSI